MGLTEAQLQVVASEPRRAVAEAVRTTARALRAVQVLELTLGQRVGVVPPQPAGRGLDLPVEMLHRYAVRAIPRVRDVLRIRAWGQTVRPEQLRAVRVQVVLRALVTRRLSHGVDVAVLNEAHLLVALSVALMVAAAMLLGLPIGLLALIVIVVPAAMLPDKDAVRLTGQIGAHLGHEQRHPVRHAACQHLKNVVVAGSVFPPMRPSTNSTEAHKTSCGP